MPAVDYLSQADVNDMVTSASTFGLFIGIIIGIAVVLLLFYLVSLAEKRNFKMYLLELPFEDRKKVELYLDNVYEANRELAKTNTRLFKRTHNSLIDLKNFLERKWMNN